MSASSGSAVAALLRLQLSVQRGRWRRASRSAADGAGLVAGWLAAAVAGTLLLVTALVFCHVGRTLIAALLEAGRIPLALVVARLLTDGCLVVTLAALALADPLQTGIDPRPVAVLPLSGRDRLVTELVGTLAAHPVALVLWPTSLALFLGVWQVDPHAGALLVPAAAGTAIAGAAAAAATRRVLLDGAGHGRFAAVTAARAGLLAAPLAWLVAAHDAARMGGGQAPHIPTPGSLVALAVSAAVEHSPRALAFGGLLHLISLAALFAVAGAAREAPLNLSDAGSRHLRHHVVPPELVRLWAPRRAAAMLAQGFAATAVVLAVGAVAHARVPSLEVLPAASSLLAVWLLVSAVSPVSANVLGQGGRAAAGLGLLPAGALPTMLRLQGWALAPAAAGVACTATAAWIMHGRGVAGVALLTGAGLLGSTVGAGSVTSVRWPWPVRLEIDGAPAWVPGPSRLILSAAHGLILGFALPALWGSGRSSAPALAAVAGAIVGAAGLALACWWLERRRFSVTEALLR